MNRFKNFFIFLYKAKTSIIIFSISFFVFFMIYFPSDIIVNIILNKINTNSVFTFTPTETSLTYIPDLGFSFNKARLTFKNANTITVAKGKIGFSLLSLLSFSPKLKAEFLAFRGNINIGVSGFSVFSPDKTEELDVKIIFNDIVLNKNLTEFISFDFAGIINGQIGGKLNLMNLSYSNFDTNILLKSLKFEKNTIMGFETPEFSISNGIIKANYSKGDISFENLSLGSETDEILLSIRGKLKTKYQKPYDFVVKLKLAGKLEEEFGSFLKIGPVAQYKNTEGIYNFKVKGDMQNPIPTFEGL